MLRFNRVAFGALALAVGATGLTMTRDALAVSGADSSTCSTKTACLTETNKGKSGGPAISGVSTSGNGVIGQTNSNTGSNPVHAGVYGIANNGAWAGVYGVGNGASHGVFGASTGYPGVRGDSFNTSGAAAIQATADASGGYPFAALNTVDGGVFTVDHLGNGQFTGLVYTAGDCSNGCSRMHRIAEYAARTTTPTLEDNGEVTMRGGFARVVFDRAFSNVFDATKNYLVSVTPEGDSKGVFVTGKTPNGFVVRENQGGHSTMAVTYRVVATALGITGQRLAPVDLPHSSGPIPTLVGR
ncbi:MAG: hypothetical protein IAI50_18455 [Candidatus Eremiobacteraeota bacterium]|nr:hypothetical protein [Candidatus Eremiobacteraeota bacterium]